MAEHRDQSKWDHRYQNAQGPADPCRVLVENQHLLPQQGQTLDLACGTGGNALFLASRSLDSHAWDISPVAIDMLKGFARDVNVSVLAQVRDAEQAPPSENEFDVIVICRFLDRALCPAIQSALRPGGLLFYQTFTLDSVNDNGPQNPAYRLATNELLKLFPDLDVLVYREEGSHGDTGSGFRDEAMLVARRPEK